MEEEKPLQGKQIIEMDMDDVRDRLGELELDLIMARGKIRKANGIIGSLLTERTHLQQTLSFLQQTKGTSKGPEETKPQPEVPNPS